MKKKVLLGLSGGIDSTVTASILKNNNYDVTGYFFDVTGCNNGEYKDAEKTAKILDIPLIYEDVSSKFKEIVIDNFVDEYKKGRTPNPCIICNPHVKFFYLLNKANEMGIDYIATGHYCNVVRGRDNKFYIKRAVNEKKDQSYMLYRLGQDVLSRLILPLGNIESKDKTRNMAREAKIENWKKKDSQEICFIPPKQAYGEFIAQMGIQSQPGDFISSTGEVLGQHKGILNYTIGQRKGLGIALGKPTFVTKIDAKTNTITLGDNDSLFTHKVISKDNIFIPSNEEEYFDKDIFAKVRYSSGFESVRIHRDDGFIVSNFKKPQRAVTPGQSIVFYNGDGLVIGGGFIE